MNKDKLFSSREDRWAYIVNLDEEMLKGGIISSEFSAEWIRNCDLCFANGAYLACVITAFQAIETLLRSDYPDIHNSIDLINISDMNDALKQRAHGLRKFRNSWIHVKDPWNDELVQQDFNDGNHSLFEQSLVSVRLVREVLYRDQLV